MSKKQQQMIKSILDLAISAKVQYNTYLQYSEAKALNNFNDKTFIKNSIDPQKIYDDFVNIFTAKIDGLYNWCLLLQIGTVAIYKIWFRNIRFTDNNDLIVDPLTLTNANFADGDVNTNRNAGNFNDTYSSENLNIEQIRLVILMKYYTQKCSGSIENLYSVLGKFLSFYYNQHSGLPYNESKNNTFIVADCLVGSEVQYQGVLYIYYNNLLAEQVDAINPEKESEKIKYVLQFSNILPQNIGQSLRFIYANPLPTDEQLLEYSKKPQQVWSNLDVANNLSDNLPENMIFKTWCNSGENNTDYKIVPIDGQNQGLVNQQYGFTPNYAKPLPKPTFAETMINLIDNSDDFNDFKVKFKNEILRLSEQVTAIGDEMNDPLAPTRQYMNGIFREIFDNILFYNKGGEIGWSPNIIYNRGDTIVVYEPSNEHYGGNPVWIYYKSIIDNNTSVKPTLDNYASLGWSFLYAWEDLRVGLCLLNMDSDIHLGQIGPTGHKASYARSYIVIGNYNNPNSPYEIYIENQSLKYTSFTALQAEYSADGSKSPYYQDINMAQSIGYCTNQQSSDGDHVLYLAKGSVIIIGRFSAPQPAQQWRKSYPVSLSWASFPLIGTLESEGRGTTNYSISNIDNTGFDIENLGVYPVGGSYIIFGKLADYVGDDLAKIRSYKNTPYYNNLSEQQKQELDEYYIKLDQIKDLTKVTAPTWLEAELQGKELT